MVMIRVLSLREDELVAAIASGDLDPYSAAESIVAEVFGE